ncbi:MAG: hydroxymethylpyrimidine/phosphomethylpyrimidine kinase [Candidatus Eremiobacteraeota bacterium]|nr:hydroxymethylpyrimidine/phosphomethylpyrimidine kinase [Candidatus Eremiobacteraeota bacterium]
MITPVLVSIGSTHPWNIAGIGLDAQVASEYGVRTASVVVGVTAQDETGMRAKFAVPTAMVTAQLASLPRDRTLALRVGAIFDEENVVEVARYIGQNRDLPVVVDPVFGASLGGAFASDATFRAFMTNMLALPTILTPNIDEAERLTGRKISNPEEMVAAAHALHARGPRAVLLKGGHLAGDPIDVLVWRSQTRVFREPRLPYAMRGTGCTLAAALACELAKGVEIVSAVAGARAYVRAKIQAQIPYGSLHVAF